MGIVFNPITANFESKSCGSASPSGNLITGTEDGTLTGQSHVFVNNVFKQILAAEDRIEEYTYADAGTKNERVTAIEYSSLIVHPGITAVKTIAYNLVGNSYVVASITRSLI
jgi:hypothetical protein